MSNLLDEVRRNGWQAPADARKMTSPGNPKAAGVSDAGGVSDTRREVTPGPTDPSVKAEQARMLKSALPYMNESAARDARAQIGRDSPIPDVF